MQTKIIKISRSDKDKDGKPYVNKNGNAYTRVGIQTESHGVKWLSGFENFETAKWQEGNTVEIEVTENGQYLNFKTLSKLDLLEKRVQVLEAKMK